MFIFLSNVVVYKELNTCYISIEFENYKIMYIPQGFLLYEFHHSIRKDRIFFSYNSRLNKSWWEQQERERAERLRMYREKNDGN